MNYENNVVEETNDNPMEGSHDLKRAQGKRKHQLLTTGSAIQARGTAQVQHKKQCFATKSAIQTTSSTQFMYQKDLAKSTTIVQHEPSKKKKIAPKCPSMSLDDFIKRNNQQLELEESEDEGSEGNDYENDDVKETNDNPVEGEASKRGRGRTLCLKIHARLPNDRQEITLNEEGEPIGPNQKTVSEFSNFLGTIARSAYFCPLIYTNWKSVPENDELIWPYVNKKYIVPDKGKKVVYAIINDAWRRYKCFIKRNHLSKYGSMRERLKNKPENIPETHFRKLMDYWRLEDIQEMCHQNAESIAQQKWRHRAGPISFAVIREKLRASKENKEPPTQAEVFIETRRSKRGKELDQDTNDAISKLQDLITNSGQPSTEAFEAVFGKEKPGRVRCYGRTATPSLLKRNKEIEELKKKHADEIKCLTDKVQEMEAKHEEMEAKHSKMEANFQLLVSAMINQNNSGLDVGALAAVFSTMDDANSGLYSSTSADAPNNHELNHGDVDEDHLEEYEDEDIL